MFLRAFHLLPSQFTLVLLLLLFLMISAILSVVFGEWAHAIFSLLFIHLCVATRFLSPSLALSFSIFCFFASALFHLSDGYARHTLPVQTVCYYCYCLGTSMCVKYTGRRSDAVHVPSMETQKKSNFSQTDYIWGGCRGKMKSLMTLPFIVFETICKITIFTIRKNRVERMSDCFRTQ